MLTRVLGLAILPVTETDMPESLNDNLMVERVRRNYERADGLYEPVLNGSITVENPLGVHPFANFLNRPASLGGINLAGSLVFIAHGFQTFAHEFVSHPLTGSGLETALMKKEG
jgi:hypothetical protein